MLAAYEIFGEVGYHGATLKAITDRVGVAQPLIFRYFKSKDELLLAILERRDAKAVDISPLDTNFPLESMRALCLLMKFNHENRLDVVLHSMMAGEAIDPKHPGHDFFVRRYAFLLDRLTELLSGCQAKGLLNPGWTPAHAARIITAAMDGLQTQWLIDPNEDLSGEFQALMEIIVKLS